MFLKHCFLDHAAKYVLKLHLNIYSEYLIELQSVWLSYTDTYRSI